MSDHETMHLELPGANLKGFELGDKVTAMVSGKLIELSAPREIEHFDGEKEMIPASVGIEVTGKAKLVPKNKFADLAEDKEGD